MKRQSHNQKRRAFTLIELLIVVAIIGVLASLSVMVLFGIDDQAREEATSTTIRKISGLVDQRLESFERAFGRGGAFADKYETAIDNLLLQKRIFGVRDEVKKILAKKIAMRHNFPQRHEDLMVLGFALRGGNVSATDFRDLNTDGRILRDELAPWNARALDRDVTINGIDLKHNRLVDAFELTITDAAKIPSYATESDEVWIDDETVSSELLYYTLVHAGNFGASPAVADQFTTAEVADTDDDGFLEFVDAWGNPLRFYRWPTRLMDPDYPTALPGIQPDLSNASDPTDVLITYQEDDGTGTLVTKTAGQRIVDNDLERPAANLLIKGLPPAPFLLPNNAIPRDLLLVDPDDPVGRIYADMERLDGTNGKPQLLNEYVEFWYHTPDCYHVPLIVSAGLDGELGLFEPSDSPNLGHLAMYDVSVPLGTIIDRLSDNITNRNKRAGGRR